MTVCSAGKITKYAPALFRVEYVDGDVEDLDLSEVQGLAKPPCTNGTRKLFTSKICEVL